MTPAPGTPPDWIPCTPATARCEFWTWRLDSLRPECCTRHLRELLAFTEDLLTRHRIFHFLDYGSLLGAVRAGALIEWDSDADFSCLRTDLDKVLKLGPEISSAGYWLDAREAPHKVRICRSPLNRAHADLWFQRIGNGFAYTWNLLHEERFRFPVRYLDALGTVTLEGRLHPAPMPVDRFLAEHRYGADFLTPRRVSADLAWIHGTESPREVRDALERLREVEYRIECIEAQRAGGSDSATAGPRGWLRRALRNVPGPALRIHRALWKAWQRDEGHRDAALLDVRYELHRREAVLRLLEAKPGNRS